MTENLELRAETLFLNGSSEEPLNGRNSTLQFHALWIVGTRDPRLYRTTQYIYLPTHASNTPASSRARDEERKSIFNPTRREVYHLHFRCKRGATRRSRIPRRSRAKHASGEERSGEFPPPCTLHNFTNRAYNRSAVAPVLQKRADDVVLRVRRAILSRESILA